MQRRVKVNDRGEEISTGNNNDNEKVPFSADPDFFELPSPAVSILVLTGLFYLMPAVAFWPEYLPPDEYTCK